MNVYENQEADARQGEFEQLPPTTGHSVFRTRYRQLMEWEVKRHDDIKNQASMLYDLIAQLPKSRQQALALTKLEEAIMWAVKGLTA